MELERRELQRALSSGQERGSAAGLPDAVLARAGKRLGTAALLVAGTFLVYAALTTFVYLPQAESVQILPPPELRVRLSVDEALQIWTAPPYMLIVTVFAVLVSVAVWALSRSSRVAPARLITVGLYYEVVVSLTLAVGAASDPAMYYFPMVGISWIAFWIGIFPLLVPAPPGRVLAAALVSSALLPIAMLVIGPALVGEAAGGLDHLNLTLPQLIASAWSYVGARVVNQYGREISRARQMGSYELEERLGEGGMGEVWLARHRFLARPAAVKLIRPERLGGSDEANAVVTLRRFEREAQATAGLRSPHTISLFDFGVAQDGTFFYVMELLEGMDLETLVSRHGPVEQERAVAILLQVCDSLSEAHDQGLLHRDIKPANIYVCSYGRRYDFVKVLDFGLVRSVGDGAHGTKLTREGVVTGTPAYLSPEQATGDGPLDHRADLYSLGCVAYWMLTGQLVFETTNPVKMALKHASEPPVPPSLRTELPIAPELEAVVMTCLAKRPEERPVDADALAEQLRGLELGDWSRERARAWWRAHLPEMVSKSGLVSAIRTTPV